MWPSQNTWTLTLEDHWFELLFFNFIYSKKATRITNNHPLLTWQTRITAPIWNFTPKQLQIRLSSVSLLRFILVFFDSDVSLSIKTGWLLVIFAAFSESMNFNLRRLLVWTFIFQFHIFWEGHKNCKQSSTFDLRDKNYRSNLKFCTKRITN